MGAPEDIDRPTLANGTHEDAPPESTANEVTEMEGLENSQKNEADSEVLADVNDETKMEDNLVR